MKNPVNIVRFLTITVIFVILLAAFRGLLTNISTSLPDSRDYPFCVWVVYQNIGHIKTLDFTHFFDSNIFYPFRGTLLFSELFLPLSFLATGLSFFIANPILVFNLLFFLTLLLDVISVDFFWRRFFKHEPSVFLATLFTVLSAFVLQNLPHFQSLNFWPLFLALGLVCTQDRRRIHAILAGVFLTLQFLSNTYLGIFGIPAILAWYLCGMLWPRDGQDRVIEISHALHTLLAFGLTGGFFVAKYIQIKMAYHITRPYGDYVVNSAQISDYFFSTHFQSLLSRVPVIAAWNSRNQHGSLFPTFTVLLLAVASIRQALKRIRAETVFFALLVVCGLIFSLGPRLTLNGVYTGLPLPYGLLLKFVPMLVSIRVIERWAFLFTIGLAYFAVRGLESLAHTFSLRKIALVTAVVYLAEVFPLTLPLERIDYAPSVYQSLTGMCGEVPKVLLEYPIEQDIGTRANVLTNLSYRTGYILASLQHHCLLVNGYSGYFPDDFMRFQGEIETAVLQGNKQKFLALLTQRRVELVKLNKQDLFSVKVDLVAGWLHDLPGNRILWDDAQFLVLKL